MRCLGVALIAAAGLPPSAVSQEPPTPAPPWDRLGQGGSVRVLTDDGIRHDGWIRRIVADTMVLELPYASDEAILLPAIDSLWVRQSNAGPAALVGAIALGVPGAAFGPQLACADEGCDFNVGERVQFFFFGAIAGALIGVVIGSAAPRWETFFP